MGEGSGILNRRVVQPPYPGASFLQGFVRGLGASLSVVLGYLPIAFSFGLAASQAGWPAFVTMLSSVILYAGASQFILIALMGSGAGWLTAVLTVLLMNARHLFYGPALLTRLAGPEGPRMAAPWLAFGLTDEVFATAIARLDSLPVAMREAWYLGLQLGAYLAWAAGTVLGVVLSHRFQDPPVFLEAALGFILPALFFAFLLDSEVRRNLHTILATAVAALVLLTFLPSYHALALAILIGAFASMLVAWDDASGP